MLCCAAVQGPTGLAAGVHVAELGQHPAVELLLAEHERAGGTHDGGDEGAQLHRGAQMTGGWGGGLLLGTPVVRLGLLGGEGKEAPTRGEMKEGNFTGEQR